MTNTNKHNDEELKPCDCGANIVETNEISDAAYLAWNNRTDTQELEQLRQDNAALREGMNGDYDLDAWLEWHKERDELAAKLEAQRKAYRDIEKTHQRSLQQHDNEVIERCAITVEGRWLTHVRKAIRALKTGEGDE